MFFLLCLLAHFQLSLLLSATVLPLFINSVSDSSELSVHTEFLQKFKMFKFFFFKTQQINTFIIL